MTVQFIGYDVMPTLFEYKRDRSTVISRRNRFEHFEKYLKKVISQLLVISGGLWTEGELED